MVRRTASILKDEWGVSDSLLDAAAASEDAIAASCEAIDALSSRRFLKLMGAFRAAGVKESHLHPSFGYGYYDSGRETLDCLFARALGAEDALVRHQLVSGTHALRCALFGLLRPGDELLVVPDAPYDTMRPIFGLKPSPGSLAEWGVSVRLASAADVLSGAAAPGEKTAAVLIQRSKGYAWQDSISIATIEKLIASVKGSKHSVKVVVDNCYGEFVEEREPCEIGADLAVGSLIKNPGGGLAFTGGYVAGKAGAVEQAAIQLTAPGLAKEVGATLGTTRNVFTGLFLAPRFVAEALKTALFAAHLFGSLGYDVLPSADEPRTDIIQAVRLGSRGKVLAFARGIQEAGPLDQGAIPEGAPMAGYADRVVMASGSFVQGGSLELSCDAPLREPYIVYLQGGLTSAHGKLGVLLAARRVLEERGA